MTHMQTAAEQTKPNNAKAGPTMCTQPGCSEPATLTYVWPWGEPGACCAAHRIHVSQKCDALGRGQVSFSTIDPNAVPVLTRDERTQLRAQVLSLQDECTEVKARGVELYKSNTDLANEARRHRVRNTDLEARVKDLEATLAETTKARDQARADLADAQTETQRLDLLLRATPQK